MSNIAAASNVPESGGHGAGGKAARCRTRLRQMRFGGTEDARLGSEAGYRHEIYLVPGAEQVDVLYEVQTFYCMHSYSILSACANSLRRHNKLTQRPGWGPATAENSIQSLPALRGRVAVWRIFRVRRIYGRSVRSPSGQVSTQLRTIVPVPVCHRTLCGGASPVETPKATKQDLVLNR